MVGIPGKSKGCHTCRRRKIRCDLQEPNCARCIRSGKECEGYQRGAIFLNKTAHGWEKRSRLDEVQPRRTKSNSPTGAGDISKPRTTSQVNASPDSPIVQIKIQSPQTPRSSDSPPTILSPDFKKHVIQSMFLQSYLPKSPKAGLGLAGAWLSEAMRLNDRSPALKYSLHALCLTRVGRLAKHQDLIKRGNAAYGFALRALRILLESPKHAGKDETLATCLILSIYELYESTSNSTNAHEEHMAGIERLVQFRGYRQNETLLGRSLFKNICYASMVKSIQYRKTSRLKDLVDKTVWWDNQGMLFAKGHTLGALLHDLDQYKESGQQDLQAAATYLKRCAALDLDFNKWYSELIADSSSPMYWTSGEEPDIIFQDINSALILIDYWALQLILSTTIDIICSQVPANIPPAIQGFVDQLKATHGKEHQLMLASNIMLSMPFCMQDENGVSSSQKCLFSGRVALFCLRRYQSDQLDMYEQRFLDLQVKKGLQFAQDIHQKEQTGWTPHISEKGTAS